MSSKVRAPGTSLTMSAGPAVLVDQSAQETYLDWTLVPMIMVAMKNDV